MTTTHFTTLNNGIHCFGYYSCVEEWLQCYRFVVYVLVNRVVGMYQNIW